MIEDKEIDDILRKYNAKLRRAGAVRKAAEEFNGDFSREYLIFKKEFMSKGVSFYENLCSSFGKVVKVKPKKKEELILRKSIDIAHLDVEIESVVGLATFVVTFLVFIWVLIGIFAYLGNSESLLPYLSFFLILLTVLLLKPLSRIPNYIASRYKLKASNQMVLCILYIVIYMRHTSNLEHAIKFAATHVGKPLSLDLRKVFWDVETGKFTTIKESLDNYLDNWRDSNLEFIDAFHLVESSLYEPSEDRRIELLDKSLEVILEGTYERMMYYAHSLNNPITMLHMLGIVLPVLGLVLLPLVASFIQEIPVSVKLWLMVLMYNLVLPLGVYIIGMSLLAKRPTGYGEEEYGFTYKKDFFLPFLIIFFFVGIGLIPFVMSFVDPTFEIEGVAFVGDFFDFRDGKPYGVGALLLSLLIPLGLGLGVGYYYKSKTAKFVEKRKEIKNLEKEFSSSLFQLGNRIGDGVPVEVAFSKVATNMKGTPTGDFFTKVSSNIQNGSSVEDAIFDDKRGAILQYNSPLIEGSMEVLIESSRKGPSTVAKSLISISNYSARIRSINERLTDLLAEIVSSMKSQITFLAPIIAGVVVGLASMITSIFAKLQELTTNIASGGTEEFGALGNLSIFFDIEAAIPSYYFQIIVGLYVVEVIYVLSVLSNGIENGADKLGEENSLGKNLMRSVTLYVIIAFLVIIIFNALTNTILGSVAVIP